VLTAFGIAAGFAGGLAVPGAANHTRNGPEYLGTVEPEVRCKYSAQNASLSVRMREGRERFRIPRRIRERFGDDLRELLSIPVSLTVERRRDAITLLGGGESLFDFFEEPDARGPVPCKGGDPTVANTERMKIRTSQRTTSAELLLELAYGDLEPGLTDEGDGTSEVELDVRIAGNAVVRLSRGADHIAVSDMGDALGLNLNASEAIPDVDATFADSTPVWLDGAGAGDVIDGSGGGSTFENLGSFYASGGQGGDVLLGGRESDFLEGGPGADEVEAGAGADAVIVSGRGSDRIDCGGGRDFVLLVGRGDHKFSRCERVMDLDDLRASESEAEIILRKAARQARALKRG
jgi:hypothetical protein